MSTTHKQNLVKKKHLVHQMILKGKPYRYKRDLLIQKGGFLPALLAPIIGLVGGLVGDLIGSAIRK